MLLVELVGIEPTTSSLRTMASTELSLFPLALNAEYGPLRSNSNRLAWSCLKHRAGEKAELGNECSGTEQRQSCRGSAYIFHRELKLR